MPLGVLAEAGLGQADMQARHVVLACYLGWTLDAFDFFIMAFALDAVAAEFHSTRAVVSWAFTLTLAMRPLGALIFGRIADRFGRRPTLMANVLIYAAIECASGFAPTLTSFLVLRALFGVAMGGEWGVGAALTMESIPASWRGPVSGLLQAGYPSGYLLATLLNGFAFNAVGWRGLFILGVLPAFLVLYIRRNVPESANWTAGRSSQPAVPAWKVLLGHAKLVGFCAVLMAGFNFFSHGTQDLYKTFLSGEHHLAAPTVTAILLGMNVAAIAGGIGCGALSQRIGRRRMITFAALCAIPVVPVWAFARDPLMIGAAAAAMQFCVQGAWGVIPAHLTELSPASLRATFPGMIYQMGNFLAATNATLQTGLADRFFGGDLAWPLAIVVGSVAVLIAGLVGLGPEARDSVMSGGAEA